MWPRRNRQPLSPCTTVAETAPANPIVCAGGIGHRLGESVVIGGEPGARAVIRASAAPSKGSGRSGLRPASCRRVLMAEPNLSSPFSIQRNSDRSSRTMRRGQIPGVEGVAPGGQHRLDTVDDGGAMLRGEACVGPGEQAATAMRRGQIGAYPTHQGPPRGGTMLRGGGGGGDGGARLVRARGTANPRRWGRVVGRWSPRSVGLVGHDYPFADLAARPRSVSHRSTTYSAGGSGGSSRSHRASTSFRRDARRNWPIEAFGVDPPLLPGDVVAEVPARLLASCAA